MKVIGPHAFSTCTGLITTGLARDGLGSADKLTELDENAFINCPKLISTGLSQNHTIESIGPNCFSGCTGLGKVPTPDEAANTGDLVLNRPASGAVLKVGSNAFYRTGFSSVYIGTAKDGISMDPSAFNSSSIKTIYVPASWWGTASWMGRSVSAGTLVIMTPLQSMSAVRKAGVAGVATVTLSVAQSFEGKIVEANGGVIKEFSLTKDGEGPTQKVQLDTDPDTGLMPAQERLSAWSSPTAPLVYPSLAQPRTYNTVVAGGEGQKADCVLADLTYTVHFDGNGATSGSMANMPMTYGQPKALASNSFKRTKADFTGWNTEADGSGKPIADKATVDELTDVQAATVTLHAQWKSTVSLTLEVLAESAPAVGGTPRPLAGCELKLSGPGAGPARSVSTGSDGLARLTGLGPGTWRLAGTRAPAGYQPLSSEYSFTVDETGGVTPEGGKRLIPADGVFHMTLDLLANPPLPVTGRPGLPAPSMAAAGAATTALSCAYLVARRLACR